MYPALHRLEAGGLVKSRWQQVDGRKRRLYAPTRKGREKLRRERGEWSAFARAVTSVLGGAA